MTTRAFAFYRIPYQTTVHVVRQGLQPMAYADVEALLGGNGFVVAPFMASDRCPMLRILPDEECAQSQDADMEPLRRWCDEALYGEDLDDAAVADGAVASTHGVVATAHGAGTSRDDYHRAFTLFHGRVASRQLEKVVLARESVMPDGGQHPVALFQRACQTYPRMFIALTYTRQSGLWLTATPEVLLEQEPPQWHTVALAGTMRYEEGREPRWSDKNIGEQRIVADYVSQLLCTHATDVTQTDAQTVRAGHLMHLRTDFRFTLADAPAAAALVQALHPTPAVCGLPKAAALRLIAEHEGTCRRYYSGYTGPWRLQGGSHLYVSLRCMTREGAAWRLFAGGGIVPDSEEQSEWNETEEKLLTMKIPLTSYL